MMRRSLLPALLLAATLRAGTAEPSATLARAASVIGDGRVHEATFVQRFTPAGFSQPRRETGKISLQAPGSMRFDYDGENRKVFSFDGTTARFYSPQERQMIVRDLSVEERARLPLVVLEHRDRIGERYRIESDGADAVRLVPRQIDDLAWIRIAIASSGQPRSLSYQTASGDRTDFDFGQFQSRPPVPVSEFAFPAPAGTRTVDQRRAE